MPEIFNQSMCFAKSFGDDRNQRQRIAIHEVLSLRYLLCQRGWNMVDGSRIIKICVGD